MIHFYWLQRAYVILDLEILAYPLLGLKLGHTFRIAKILKDALPQKMVL